MRKFVFFLLIINLFAFPQRELEKMLDEGMSMKDVVLPVDQSFSNENTRREVYGKLQGVITPGYKQFYFGMSEEDLRQAIVDAKLITGGSKIDEKVQPIYHMNKPDYDFVFYNSKNSEFLGFSFVENIETIKRFAWKDVRYLGPDEDRSFKVLTVNPPEDGTSDWEYKFILFKKGEATNPNGQDPYRLMSIKLMYKNPTDDPIGGVFYPMPGEVFNRYHGQVLKDLGAPYLKRGTSVSKQIQKTYYLYKEDVKFSKTYSRPGNDNPLGERHEGKLNMQVIVSYMTLGSVKGNLEVDYIDGFYTDHILDGLRRATSFSQRGGGDKEISFQ